MDLKFTFFLFHYQRSFFIENTTFQNSVHIDKACAKRMLFHFVPADRSHSGTRTLPYLLTAPELLVIKLVK